MKKTIAIIGSSGGNLYNLGGKDPLKLLQELVIQLESAGIGCGAIQFVGADASMDNAKGSTQAALYGWDETLQAPKRLAEGSLDEINQVATQLDQDIAAQIHQGRIGALIMMSADPTRTNAYTVEAAIDMNLPITGTGGTSMALTSAKGANVLAVSGTTGTTNRTRAVTFVTTLCQQWGLTYRPIIGATADATSGRTGEGSPWRRISIRGIMLASLPGFIAMALLLALSKIPALAGLSEIFDIMIKALPVVLAAIAAKQISDLDEVSIVSGIIAGVMSVEGGIIGGIIGGIGAGLLGHVLFRKCVQWRFPATTVNIVAGGLSGLISGLIVYFMIAPIALQAGEGIRWLLEAAVSTSSMLAGLLAGLLIWPAILGGVYHAAILPIVLLEMERTGNSFLGAVDMAGLVMVSAGITLANIFAPRDKGEAAVAVPGFLINIGFGTFVEAAYPFMFSNKFIFGGAIVSAGLGGLLVGMFEVQGTAYVPSFMAPLLSNNMTGFIVAMVGSLLSAFMITLTVNQLSRKSKRLEHMTKQEVQTDNLAG
ncbi:putative phosphotransferase system component [Paenibacillus alvei TS-15]|uniref:Putative phosphotransferase system component n=1 Tax=Paenibacillus alvei TS-15 TaxID=1117108 RepID=S9U697_PAEAL|nr:putative phosphotransferase system component [Paenibacillus alvei]EPY06000.1 putative phosphotransferase system component [Paenibacillus alvei TS-15]